MEETPNTLYQLYVAYSIVLALMVCYLLSLGMRLSRLERNLTDGKK